MLLDGGAPYSGTTCPAAVEFVGSKKQAVTLRNTKLPTGIVRVNVVKVWQAASTGTHCGSAKPSRESGMENSVQHGGWLS